jgi:hypothetical protein
MNLFFLESFNMPSSEGLLIVGCWIFLLSDARQAYTHAVAVEGPLLADLLHRLLRPPLSMLLLWNWKSALLSMILRAPIFLIASIRRGWAAAFTALLTESVFCAVTVGFYGRFVQLRPQC